MAILPSTHEHRSDPLRADAGARFFSGVRWGFLQQGVRRYMGEVRDPTPFVLNEKTGRSVWLIPQPLPCSYRHNSGVNR